MGPLKLFSRCRYKCLKTLYWTPIVLVLCLVVWNYYVNVFVLNLSGQYTQPFSAILVLGSHCLLFLQLLSFIRTIFTKHKPIPSKFVLSTEQLDTMNSLVDIQPFILKLAANLPLKQLTSPDGGIRYCSHCKLIKPDRCHHCSSCGRCILKMDHHCYLVNNCLGYSNYKYFFLFLMYTITLGLGFCIFSFHDVTHIWKDTYNNKSINKNNVIFCFGFVGFFSISTTCQFFVHLYLILVNRTFLENLSTIRGPERRFYYLGIRRNLRAVFGRNIILAFLPVHTSEGDGASFPIRSSYSNEEYQVNTTYPPNHTHSFTS